jgi:hypothetical protein
MKLPLLEAKTLDLRTRGELQADDEQICEVFVEFEHFRVILIRDTLAILRARICRRRWPRTRCKVCGTLNLRFQVRFKRLLWRNI